MDHCLDIRRVSVLLLHVCLCSVMCIWDVVSVLCVCRMCCVVCVHVHSFL